MECKKSLSDKGLVFIPLQTKFVGTTSQKQKNQYYTVVVYVYITVRICM